MTLEELKEIFSNIEVPEQFGRCNDGTCDEMLAWGIEICKKYLPTYKCMYGASKFIFISEEEEWVIKIPFNGYFYKIYNPSRTIFYKRWKSFKYQDYCNIELNKYIIAKELGIKDFFAEIQFLCNSKNNHPIYIQEKIIPEHGSNIERLPTNEGANFVSNRIFFDNIWIAKAYDYYGGEEKIKQFMHYIKTIDPEISRDLHPENYGYRPDGSPCLLDYSGWLEGF